MGLCTLLACPRARARYCFYMFARHGERGFTLIELLVVIAIIGILSSVVLASLNGARVKGRDARRLSDLKQIQIALELYYDSGGGTYPNDIYAATGSLTPTHIASVPKDPRTNAVYNYQNLSSTGGACTTSGTVKCPNYVLGADLEDAAHPAFANEDINGVKGSGTDSVDCTDPKYCVMP